MIEEIIKSKPSQIYEILHSIKHERLCFRNLFSIKGLSQPKLKAIAQDLRDLVALRQKYADDSEIDCYLQKTCLVIDYGERLAHVEAAFV